MTTEKLSEMSNDEPFDEKKEVVPKEEIEPQKGRKLSARQQQFVNEYLIDSNGRLAACRAGYAKRSASATAARLLATPEIIEGIQARKHERAEHRQVTQEAVVRELAAVGFANLTDVCTWDDGRMTLINSSGLTHEQAASIAEITETVTSRGGTVRVKQHSKLKALEMLAKHVGLYDSPEPDQAEKSLEELSPVLKKRLETIYGIITDDRKNQSSVDGASKL
ncbi:terminase small subunit [Halodesulfovibrio marinisediminis]|uniref:Phage terminase, small subunit n=1 Tax=Halodesulfovibrio marinisediminis DSM 17456 TaxID=1121457 RepID=A0A1N6IV57_9BACT|nr:terminase small subunit [Halodesulfovibrio marinisediminis]SIO35913.1 Phage terminase, small subunit [Halodesulfovibrio marinisediminis DSM 17456]